MASLRGAFIGLCTNLTRRPCAMRLHNEYYVCPCHRVYHVYRDSSPCDGLSSFSSRHYHCLHTSHTDKNLHCDSTPWSTALPHCRFNKGVYPATDNNIKHEAKDKSSKGISSSPQTKVKRPKRSLKSKRPKPIQDKETFNKKLNENSRERVVPGSRAGRVLNFGQLAMGLAAGVVAESTKRGFDVFRKTSAVVAENPSILDNNLFLTEANAERIVNTLCRVRGAALKLGQTISIQDTALISPQLQKIFERVRHSADFMPRWQMENAMKRELGENWRDRLASFDDQPFAAASIGQVHRATLHDGREVAMKIQYPGVADSIDSDLDNLISVLKVIDIFPEGMYAENMVEFARKELAWECDYMRESANEKRFRKMIKHLDFFYVPEIIPELTTTHVLTHELVSGDPVDQLRHLPQATLNLICSNILHLCLEELFIFGFMQTDPNWSNFLYDERTGRVTLLDFGASREFGKEFTDGYIEIIHCGTRGDSEGILHWSKKLGFLTGFEAQAMKDAHLESVMILGEAFRHDRPFDFGSQTTSARIHSLIPTMLKHRLTPPPEEVYSLHRKMAGCFLLCSKLKAVITCKPLFREVYRRYINADDQRNNFSFT